jgi:polyisoprenoid-binding protein YceI
MTGALSAQDEVFISEKGTIQLKSEAPLEIIQARSSSLKGAINPETKAFAFSVNMSSFNGFNSDIQRTHFLENYMEQKDYPQATFIGKIIEDIPFDTQGTYLVRAKGELTIHGVVKERIIKGTLIIKNNSVHLQTDFTVPVADHGIAIPKIVKQKIAEQITVSVDAEFVPEPKS